MSAPERARDRVDAAPVAVLIVDDRPENLRALEAALEPLGVPIVTAASGPEALRLLLSERFSVILLDVQMPEMDGFETAEFIRRRDKTRSIPIIFLTAISSSPEHVFRGYEAGAVDYIVKPIDPAILRSKVGVFVELDEKNREIARQSSLLQDQERDRAEHAAAEQRHRRSKFLAAAAASLEQRLDVKGRAAQLAQTCIPELADFAFVQLETEGVVELAAVGTRGAHGDGLRKLVGLRADPSSFGTWVFKAPRAKMFEPVTAATWRELGLEHETEMLSNELRPRALIAAPLALGRRSLGVLVVGTSTRGRYGEEELEIAKDLARKAAMAVENSRMYEAERDRSKALQLSLLGRPQVTSTAFAAAMRYLPGSAELEVGGDWYDVIERDDGRVLLAVGDVVGHGVQAATAMGKLRSAMGALGLVVDSPPELLRRLDQFAERIEEARFGTVAAVMLEPDTGTVRYSLAGHPPPLVVDADGHVEFLEEGRGLPLCISSGLAAERSEGRTTLREGSTLVLYTDGLIERRDDSIDNGLDRLKSAVAARCALEPERMCDELVGEFATGSLDDVVLLCLRREASDVRVFCRTFLTTPKALQPLRRELRGWLLESDLDERQVDDVIQACAEGCTNTVRHAYGEQTGEATLELRLRRDGTLLARIRDGGRWRTQSHADSSGHGLDIMRALSDEVHVHTTQQGTTVLMEMRLGEPFREEPEPALTAVP
jgi:serine phosphatase RsbU (regulator of sigma subunit)/anti-sigma regulatory factor (Ser/Thr protein kinase)